MSKARALGLPLTPGRKEQRSQKYLEYACFQHPRNPLWTEKAKPRRAYTTTGAHQGTPSQAVECSISASSRLIGPILGTDGLVKYSLARLFPGPPDLPLVPRYGRHQRNGTCGFRSGGSFQGSLSWLEKATLGLLLSLIIWPQMITAIPRSPLKPTIS